MGFVLIRTNNSFTAWAILVCALVLSGCAQDISASDVSEQRDTVKIKANMLVHLNGNDIRWFRDVEIIKGTNAYEFTEQIAQENMESTYYASMFSHLVVSLFGTKNEEPHYWIIFLWDASRNQWGPLQVGADLFSLKDGHVLAWAYTEYSQDPIDLPFP